MPTFAADKAEWIRKEVAFSREKIEVRARESEKSAWRRKLNLRKTKAVAGLPAAIPGRLNWGNGGEHSILFGWKAILPLPSNGIGLHARDDKGVYLICSTPQCPHGVAAAVTRKKYDDLKKEIETDFGIKDYDGKYIYGQFYRADNGHTFVRLLPNSVDSFDPAAIELLKARRMLVSLPFIFDAMDVLADRLAARDIASLASLAVGAERKRARLVTGWRHAAAVSRAVGGLWLDEKLPGWKDLDKELAKGDKADLKAVAAALEKLVPDKDGKWTVEGVKKAAAVVARAFYALQAIVRRALGDGYLAVFGITLKVSKPATTQPGLLEEEDYRFPVDAEGRAFFKTYMDEMMACRQLTSRPDKNRHRFIGTLAAMIARSATDLEVLELFGLSLAYIAWEPGFQVEVKNDLERAVMTDLPSLKGAWTMVDRVAQPQDDPDYPGFVVSIYRREKDGARDFILVPKGTSLEDGKKAKDSERTRDQADKLERVSTGVEADGDPAGVAYHATKKYFKRVLLKKLRDDYGATPDSNIIVAGHSLGGALTERIHLKMYEFGFKKIWSVAFSPPALDARTISKALFKDEQMGPAAFERLTAIGGTWDVVTKGGDTGACIPLRILGIRPWAPGTFTPVPYSVAGNSTGDQRFLQHGVLYQHECKFAGWRLVQHRRTNAGALRDRVEEQTDDSYMVYDYCKDVTAGVFELSRTPWGMEHMLTADDSEKAIRKEFTVAPASDKERAKTGSVAKYVKEVMVLSDGEAVKEDDRKTLEQHLVEAGKRFEIGVRVIFEKGADDLAKKLKDSIWATGCILNPGKNGKDEKLKKAIEELKIPLAEVQLGEAPDAVTQHRVVNKGLAGYDDALTWMATVMSV
ncbi:MAG: hypothetical protein ACXWLM_05880 [Myxococcales bacterium]